MVPSTLPRARPVRPATTVRRRTRSFALVGAVLLVVSAMAGCGARRADPHVVVTPTASRADEPVAVRVSGLEPGSSADVRLRSVDASGVTWTSQASFVADADGSVDLARSAATAGSYRGVSGMGLFSTMAPAPLEDGFRWPTTGPATFELGVQQGGRSVAIASVPRTLWESAPTIRRFTMAADGFAGTFLQPAGTPRGPAVLVLGGSEGGDPAVSALALASRGVPALSVAYFKAPGLPSQLRDIPLEYFDAPLRWLRRQPSVDPAQVWIWGVSRGSEAAALVAIGRPGLVHGLLDLSPSSVANCAYEPESREPCPGAAWTRAGRAVPTTRQQGIPVPTDVPAAALAVEKVHGPVLTLCGGADALWNSCAYSAALQQRLQDHHSPFPRLALSYPDAGHAVGFPMPYEPFGPPGPGALPEYGSTSTANDEARADAWPRLLAFLHRP